MISTSNKLIFYTWAGWIFDFFDLILYSFLLIGIQQEFQLSDTQVALVYSFSLAITAVGGVVLGYLGDLLGRRPAIILSVFIFSLGTLLSAFSWSLYSLLAFRIVTGFGIGGEWAAGHTLINESLPKGQRGHASSIIQSGAPVGAALASVVGGFITPIIGWRTSFILASIPSFILVVAMVISLPESPQFIILKQEAKDERDNEDVPTGTAYIRTSTKRSFQTLLGIRKHLFLGTVLSLMSMMAYWVVYTWTPKYLVTIGFSDHQAGFWMIFSQVGAFIGYLSFGYISKATGKFRGTFAGYAVVFAAGIVLFSFASSLSLSTFSLIAIFIAGLGTGIFSGFGPLYARLFPVKVRNTSASFCFNFGRLGAFVAPLMVVSIANIWGFSLAIGSGAIFAIFAALWVFTINPDKIEYDNKYESVIDEEEPVLVEQLVN